VPSAQAGACDGSRPPDACVLRGLRGPAVGI